MAVRHAAVGLAALLALLLSPLGFAAEPPPLTMLSGPQGSVQHQIALELADAVARPDMSMVAIPTTGPGELLQRLRDEERQGGGIQLALLQADVAQLYLLAAQGGNRAAGEWLAPLRVIAPLYPAEFHVIVRADSPMQSLRDLKDARINVGPLAGGTALTVANLYRMMFDAAPAPDKLTQYGDQDALTRLLTDKSVDAVAVLGDQPVPLLANLKPEARRFIRLLKFDRTQPAAAGISRVYGVSALRAASYPALLDEDLPALAVRVYLVVHGKATEPEVRRLHAIAGSYCAAIPSLKASGNRAWQDIAPGLPALAPGWHYSDHSTPALARCLGLADNEIPDSCQPLEQSLGLCRATITVAPATERPARSPSQSP